MIDEEEWAEMRGWRAGLTAPRQAVSTERPEFETGEERRAFDNGFYQGKKDRAEIVREGRRKATN